MTHRILNVGGGPSREIPHTYEGWAQDLLDIDPGVNPDIVCDAKAMHKLPAATYDAIYSSHMLEHFYKHEVEAVLSGFRHVLKPDGFVEVAVPDMADLFEKVRNRDIDDIWYNCGAGPITFHDVIYGWSRQVGQGNFYYAHKCGFTEKSLTRALVRARFSDVRTAREGANLLAFAFCSKPKPSMLKKLGVL